MAGEKQQHHELHVALLPWLAFGHLNPFLHLAISLADVGLRISYLSTHRNIRRLPLHTIPPHLSSNIKFIALSMPSVDGLPDNAESTVDLTADVQHPLLRIAFDRLQDQVKKFLAGDDPPSHMIYDFLAHWAPEAALEVCGIPSLGLSILPSSTMAFLGWPPEGVDIESEEGMKQWWPSPESFMSLPHWIPFETKIHFRRWEAEMFYRMIFINCPSGASCAIRRVRSIQRSSGAVAVRCCNEFNSEFLELLPEMLGKPVIPIGWLPPTVIPLADNGSEEGREETLEWLDRKPPKSVVFVCFGSEFKLNKVAISELAHGLELSELPFLWALRRPDWLASGEEDDKALPDGFQDRTRGRGLVSFDWVPQLRVLAHVSVGGILFHGGASTAIESLSFGLVSVLLSGYIDQGLISQRLVEKGVGVEIERKEADGSFDRHDVAKALRTAMVSDEAQKLRENAEKFKVILGDKALHDKYIRGLVDFLAKTAK